MRSRLLLLVLAIGVGSLASGAGGAQRSQAPRILVFTKTTGFRHASIPVALRAIRQLAARSGLAVDATGDAGKFTRGNLARYRAVVFLLTSGDVLDEPQQAAFERFIRAGGGYAGIHSAADTEPDWAWYGQLLGTHFRVHPQIQRAVVSVTSGTHPSTVGLPHKWTRMDEWYSFTRNPRPSVRVLATLDERTYSPGEGAMGVDHPIAWAHRFQGGRAWYTAGGHTDESYSEPLFRKHLIGGIRYASAMTPPILGRLTPKLRDRLLSVTVRFRSCFPCSGTLTTIVRGRRHTSSLRLDGRLGRGSGRLPAGRWDYEVALRDPLTGLTDRLRRSVTVP
jgi:type 1 glutamine amidotransferase